MTKVKRGLGIVALLMVLGAAVFSWWTFGQSEFPSLAEESPTTERETETNPDESGPDEASGQETTAAGSDSQSRDARWIELVDWAGDATSELLDATQSTGSPP